jgi:hypothetical protein
MLRHKTFKQCRRLFQTILKGWRISYNPRAKDKARVFIDEKRKRAVVFSFGKRKVPDDYFLHEFLHVCMRAVKSDKHWCWKEEQFVQRLCRVIEEC